MDASDLDEAADQGGDLSLLVASVCESVFNLAQSLNDEDLHGISHLCDQDLLMDRLDDVVEGQRAPVLQVQNLCVGVVVLGRGQPSEDLIYFIWTGSASHLEDSVDSDCVVGHGT